MPKKYRKFIRANLASFFFMIVSFISVTLAWFAYSGLTDVATEIDIKSWNIRLEKDGQAISNDVVISLPQIYPGMDTVTETINIKNLGDADASLKYRIVSARILGDVNDNFVVNETITSPFVEDAIAHNYPFHVNINISKAYVLAKTDESTFKVSVSWPLDSADDVADSLWGGKAYEFQTAEQALKDVNPQYQMKPPIKVVISVEAEQYIESPSAIDPDYNLGDTVLYDVVDDNICTTINATCLKTYVIEENNTIGDQVVNLLPDPTNAYSEGGYNAYNATLSSITSTWTANYRALTNNDVLSIISNDIVDSKLIRAGISDDVIGTLNYPGRIDTAFNKAILGNGYYRFANTSFNYLNANTCYWTNTEYNTTNAMAVKAIDVNNSKLYPELKSNNCSVIPVILMNK